ncbi:MAG: hypothetical protein BZY88_20730 [SAR202 cluster bacterium Io17-Chloro-G9]|nr:MAG: hypothetical protein BZY88_20730 [SAR202 cluster bacterium Io17-Chloro-G9]
MKSIELTVPALQKGVDAMTLWPFIIYRRGAQDNLPLRCHEWFHWRHALRWGVLPWYLAYILIKPWYLGARTPQHPFEAPAYAKQRQIIDALAGGRAWNNNWPSWAWPSTG